MARVLVIDDDEALLSALEAMLMLGGHSVATANNGVKGAKLFRAEPFDLIITDIVMPDGEGLETITALRQEFPGVGVIAMSGGTKFSGTYLEVAQRLGASCTLLKPFTSAQLEQAITESLGTAS